MRFPVPFLSLRPFAIVWIALLSALCAPAAEAQGAATLQSGTVLELYAVGTPDFRFRIPVSADGKASFPLIEPVNVAGRTLEEVRADVKAALAQRVYRHRTGDGREVMINFQPQEIVVNVAEYPPVYVTGDVRTPGAVAYHPEMSVRQAVALAGGYDRLGEAAGDLRLRATEFRGEAQKLMLEQTALEARRAALEAVLDGETPTEPDEAAPQSSSASREVERLDAQEEAVAAERTSLTEAISVERARLAEIEEERARVADEMAAQETTVAEVRDLYDRGIAPSSRLNDELRYLSDVRERALSLSLRQAEAEREIARLQQRRTAIGGQQRIEFMTEMQETVMRLDAISADLRSLEQRYDLAARGAANLDGEEPAPVVSLFRRGEDDEVRLAVSEGELLRPGDVLEIRLPSRSLSEDRF